MILDFLPKAFLTKREINCYKMGSEINKVGGTFSMISHFFS